MSEKLKPVIMLKASSEEKHTVNRWRRQLPSINTGAPPLIRPHTQSWVEKEGFISSGMEERQTKRIDDTGTVPVNVYMPPGSFGSLAH